MLPFPFFSPPQVTIIYHCPLAIISSELHPWYCHSSVLCSLTWTTVHLVWVVRLHIAGVEWCHFLFSCLRWLDIPPTEILESKLLTRYKDIYGFHSGSVPHLHCSHFLAHAPLPWHAKLPVVHTCLLCILFCGKEHFSSWQSSHEVRHIQPTLFNEVFSDS